MPHGAGNAIRVRKIAAPLRFAEKGEIGACFQWSGPFRETCYRHAEQAADLNARQSLRAGTRYEIRAWRTAAGMAHGVAWYRHPSMDEGVWPRQARQDLPSDVEWSVVLEQKTTPTRDAQ